MQTGVLHVGMPPPHTRTRTHTIRSGRNPTKVKNNELIVTRLVQLNHFIRVMKVSCALGASVFIQQYSFAHLRSNGRPLLRSLALT